MRPAEAETGRRAVDAAAATERTHRQIIEVLEGLLNCRYASPLEPGFAVAYRTFLDLFGRYQTALMEAQHRAPTCAAGCSMCCCHWVEDVYSFETEIIADRIRRSHRDRLAAVVAACGRDIEVMERLDRELDGAAAGRPGAVSQGALDERTERLLSAYYGLRRPCPLLTAERRCMVYDVRPLTCRVYLSFSAPSRCDPDHADERDVPTCLVDLEESASALLDELHVRYDRFDNDTSLRSALVACLAPGGGAGGTKGER